VVLKGPSAWGAVEGNGLVVGLHRIGACGEAEMLGHGERFTAAVRLQVGAPPRIPVPGADDAPGESAGWRGWSLDAPPEFGQMSVALHMIAAAAGRDDIVPAVLTTAAARPDMVHAGGRRAAVDATPVVAGEQSPSGERHRAAKRHPHKAGQTDDGRRRDGAGGAVQGDSRVLQADCLVVEDQDECAVHRYDTERLI